MYSITTATRRVSKMSKRIRAIQWGTSASKTISILLYLIARAQSDKVQTLTSIVAESLPHLKRGAMRDFLNIMKEHNYYKDELFNKTDFTYTFETGSKIEFFSADSPDKLRWSRRDRLFLNECNNLDYESFQQLEVRTKEFVFLDWNPSNEFWYYTDLQNREDVEHIILTYKDNEALSPEIVWAIEMRKNNASWWTVYWEGKLGVVEGRIYRDWQIIDDIPHEARLEIRGLDFGYTNDPSALISVYYYNWGYILNEELYQHWLGNRAIAEIIRWLEAQCTVIADSSEPKSIDEIKSYWIAILPTVKWPDSIRNGIQIVQDQRISVTKRSVALIKEYRNYMWAEDKSGKATGSPVPWGDHALDAVRYALSFSRKSSSNFDFSAFEKSELQKSRNIYNDIWF